MLMKTLILAIAGLFLASTASAAHVPVPQPQNYLNLGACYAEYFTSHGSYSDFTCTFNVPRSLTPGGYDNVLTTAATGDPDVTTSVFIASAYETGPLGLSGDTRVDVGFRVANTSPSRGINGIVRVNVVLVIADGQTKMVWATQ